MRSNLAHIYFLQNLIPSLKSLLRQFNFQLDDVAPMVMIVD